ncbi:MAG: rod-binding protein [Chloroflexi bacterium]|nr:rod-binding protein [Chloroflexota bacterium]
MNGIGLPSIPTNLAQPPPPVFQPPNPAVGEEGDDEFRKTFQQFVGQTLFGQMLKAMRSTVGKPAYFHGGRAEEIFRQQLDQVLAEKLAKASGEQFSQPMFDLFSLNRRP